MLLKKRITFGGEGSAKLSEASSTKSSEDSQSINESSLIFAKLVVFFLACSGKS